MLGGPSSDSKAQTSILYLKKKKKIYIYIYKNNDKNGTFEQQSLKKKKVPSLKSNYFECL